ncbi:hypothetical protein [Rhizobium yanglingense]
MMDVSMPVMNGHRRDAARSVLPNGCADEGQPRADHRRNGACA